LEDVEVDWPVAEVKGSAELLIEGLDKRAGAALAENSQLEALRDTLLPALLSGRIRVPAAAELVEAS